MADDAERGWKGRYEKALKQMSEQARAAGRLEDSLRSAISRLAVLGLGSDRELDRRLESLRRVIHDGADTKAILECVDAISTRVRLLSEAAERQPGQPSGDPLRHLLLNLLNLIRRLDAEDNRVPGLLVRIHRAEARDLPALSMAVENMLTQKLTRAVEEADRPRLLRMFGGSRRRAPGGTEAMQLLLDRLVSRWPARDLEPLAARLQREGGDALIPVAVELSELLERVSIPAETGVGDGSAGSASLAMNDGRALKQLLSALRLPDEFADSAEALTRQADEAFTDPDRLSGWLTELAGLVRHFRTQMEQERKALQRYLERTLDRLAELDGHLDAGEEESRRNEEQLHEVSHHLDGELNAVRRSMTSAADIASVQKQIDRHLDALGKGLKLRRRLDEERERSMERRFGEMRERVAELERESDQLRDSLKRESRRSVLDPLTRLPNRRAFQERIAYEKARYQRREKPLSLLICSLEDVSLVNERLGHEAGDVAIADFAEKLAESVRPGDFAARLDGVEFVVVLPDLDGESATHSARDLGLKLADGSFEYDEVPFSISAVFGVAEFTPDETPESVLRRARKAMGEARQNGHRLSLAPPPASQAGGQG
ncbi:GGDEF domain-containing protein [Natronospira bacteriovora]|uniref:diguanylate cyclase n=1 Tax=Natronospira bacteriovora TaxID=3069753 RepID=A0ABU0W6H6_9GAMM|nr:GGDEF domain-containing protein [Natronospira sp. AB-CW4]MDQ2069626.1 GGDEF domain-containing protein [Natronospira sp. AB-CW4]